MQLPTMSQIRSYPRIISLLWSAFVFHFNSIIMWSILKTLSVNAVTLGPIIKLCVLIYSRDY